MKDHASPSQITTADRCLRKWFLESVKGIRTPDTPGPVLGSHVHYLLERRLQHKQWDKEAPATSEWKKLQAKAAYINAKHIDFPFALGLAKRLLGAAIEHLPLAELEGGRIEVPFRLTRPTLRLPLVGRADLVMPGWVLDWKTTSSLNYLKKPEEFAADAQVLTYGEAFNLPFIHVYVQTKGLALTHVEKTELSPEVRAKNFLKIEATIGAMVDVVADAKDDWRKVPGNLDACKDFGGCPHRARCANKTQEVVMDFASRRAQLAAAGAVVKIAEPSDLPAPGMGDLPRINPPEAAKIPAPAPGAPPAAPGTLPVSAAVQAPPKAGKKAAAAKASQTAPLDSQGDYLLTPSEPTRTLYIGCLPVNEHVVMGADLLAPYAAAAAKLFHVAHWTQVEFGKAAAAIQGQLFMDMEAGRMPQALYLDRRDQLAERAVELLIPYYADGGKGRVIQKVG
jgi:hypothetical protein